MDTRSTLVYLVAGTAVAASVWTTFVPEWISGFTFSWILAATIGLLVVSATAKWSTRPSSSVVQVLCEAEHPPAVAAQRGALHDTTPTG